MNYSYLAVARLKPGVIAGAGAVPRWPCWRRRSSASIPKENEGIGAEVVPMLDDTVATVRTPLYILLAAVAAMLLIGCANLANLLLARALVRQRELAVRAALGAARARLIMQSIGELVPMLVVGGALGLLGAAWAIAALVPLLPADIPRVENVGLHLPVLAGTRGHAGGDRRVRRRLAGARSVARRACARRLPTSRAVTPVGRARSRVRDLLVVAQIAATLWLVDRRRAC